ncbi:PilZ domain-containing protein [Sesbania bispinosa]|nr:PilZ domain-containing protein [Sesbania bispinosa]
MTSNGVALIFSMQLIPGSLRSGKHLLSNNCKSMEEPLVLAAVVIHAKSRNAQSGEHKNGQIPLPHDVSAQFCFGLLFLCF